MQEIKGDVKDPFTFAVVGHASYIPLFSFAFGHDGIFSCFGFESDGFVPCLGYLGDETCTLVVAIIEGRIVCHHLQAGFKKNKECHLIGTCADAGRIGTFGMVDFRLHAKHGAGSIVHGSYCVAYEGEIDTVVGTASAHLLHTSYAFVGEYVWVFVF